MAGEVKKLSLSEGTSITTPTDLSFGNTVSTGINDNTSPAADVTGMLFDGTTVKAVNVSYDLERRNDVQDDTESGTLYLSHDNENSTWLIGQTVAIGNAGVVFTITSAGQLQFTSTNYGGFGYSATARFLNTLISE